MMKLLITGGNGFIARNLAGEFQDNERVQLVDKGKWKQGRRYNQKNKDG